MDFGLSPESGVTYAVTDRIARITLNRLPVNALTLDMIRGIVAALQRATADDDVRAVVLASALPRRFCAGLQLDLVLGQSVEAIRELVSALYLDLHDALDRFAAVEPLTEDSVTITFDVPAPLRDNRLRAESRRPARNRQCGLENQGARRTLPGTHAANDRSVKKPVQVEDARG